MRNYEIWHDEYKGDGKVNEYWHGIFFVPVDRKVEIISLLKQIRDKHKYSHNTNIKFAGSLENKKQGRIVKNNLDLFSHLLIVKENEAKTPIFDRDGKDKYEKTFNPFLEIIGVFGCKLVLFYIPDNHSGFNKYPMDYPSRVETTFRMGFKGGSHLLFSSQNSINITKFYFDGYEHHTRNIDIDRISKGNFRDYCSVDDNCIIDDRQIKDRNDDSKIMMSFIDNIIGAWTAKIQNKKDVNNILHPINDIYERLLGNKIVLNTDGKWHKSITISEVYVKNGKIEFPDIFRSDKQGTLF